MLGLFWFYWIGLVYLEVEGQGMTMEAATWENNSAAKENFAPTGSDSDESEFSLHSTENFVTSDSNSDGDALVEGETSIFDKEVGEFPCDSDESGSGNETIRSDNFEAVAALFGAPSSQFFHGESVLFHQAQGAEKTTKEPVSYKFRANNSKCSSKCSGKCPVIILSWTKEELARVKDRFKGNTLVESKNKLLTYLKSQFEFGASVKSYVVNGHAFCIKFLSGITSVSEFILKNVHRDFLNGAEQYVHGNDSKPRESLACLKFISWFKVFCENFGQSAPDECTTVLPSWLTKATLFEIYVKEATPPLVKKSTFYFLFKSKFGFQRIDKLLPHVRISSYSTHSKCDQCVALDTFQRSCKTKHELEYCRALKYNHKQKYGLARRRINDLEQLAVSFPQDHVFISIDGMDNRKSDLPRFQENAKRYGGFTKLACHITGAIITSGLYPDRRKCLFYINHDQFENGSNLIVTIIYKLIEDFLKDHKKLPRILHINTDNCGRENKNRFVFSFLAALVELRVFTEITMDFMLVGHTGNSVDQLFSCLAKVFKESEMKSVDDLIDKIENSPIAPKPVCTNLFYIHAWKEFIEGKLSKTKLENHSFYHSFKISKEISNEKEKTLFRGKLYPQDAVFGPKEGIVLIQDGTEFDSIGAADFRIHKLQLTKVFQSLQKYICTLPLNLKMTVTSSWEALRKTLESLEKNRDNLRKMRISELPKQVVDTASEIPEHLSQFVEDEEYPELNGEIHQEDPVEACFGTEISVDTDVVIYTRSKLGRPWVGRIVQVLEGEKFSVQWYQRRGRGTLFIAMVNSDGSPVLSVQQNAVVMYWHMSTEKTVDSFRLSHYWLEKIKLDYAEHDEAYE